MAVTDLPARKLFKCDCCGATTEESASTSRPSHWCNLHVLRDAYDFQGCAVADASVKLLLCTPCTTATVAAVNAVVDEVRAAIPKARGQS